MPRGTASFKTRGCLLQVRQLAAVLLRRRVGGLWGKAAVAALQSPIKAALLHQLEHEAAAPVRRNIASVVCVVAKRALPAREWPELYGFLQTCMGSAAPAQRAVAMELLASLLESEEVVECLEPHLRTMAGALATLLSDSVESVSHAALAAAGAWARAVLSEEDAALISPLVPPILAVGTRAAHAGDDQTVALACGIMDDVAECAVAASKPHVRAMLEFALATAAAAQLEMESRAIALQLTSTIVAGHRRLIGKQQLAPGLLRAVFEACCEPEGEEADEDEASLHRYAAQVLESLSESLASKHLMPTLMELVAAAPAEAAPARQRALLVALGLMAHGCAEPFSSRLPQLMPLVYAGCGSAHGQVRDSIASGIA